MKHQVSVRIESPAFDADAVRIIEITGTETISRLFEMTLRLAALEPGALDEEKLLTSHVELVFERTDDKTLVMTEERRIGGMISALRDRFLTESDHREVIATFVPRAWQTTLTETTDIFMDMTIPEIVKKKLETGAGLVDADVEMRLKQTYAKREFVVQYKESDLAFISRLTEDLGIHFFFERKKDKDVLVFGDENAAFLPSTPDAAPFMKRGEDAGVHRLESVRHRIPKMFKARDYNYRNPAMDLVGEAQTKAMASAGSVDEFGPHAKTAEEATYYAQLRAEEAGARHRIYEGRSDLPGIRAGSILKVEGHPGGDLALVVVEVRHEGRQAVFGATVDDAGYHNVFKAIADSVTFRPARVTPKPVVHGVVTGIVQTEAATNFGAIDAEGRYRVSFMYDTVTGRGDGKASRPLRMAQPSAGAERGFHQPLKVGTEVIITCLNGDPDRPIISGAVPNPQTPSPVTSANAEKSMWKTNVNQIAIDDDQPRMKMTVNGEDHLFQIGEPNGPEFGFMQGTVGNATSMTANVSTTASNIKSSWDAYKSGFASDDIVGAAGIPNPWAAWKKWEALASGVADTIKTVSSVVEGVADLAQGDLVENRKKKTEADEKKAEADKKKAKADRELEAALKAANVDAEAVKPLTTVDPNATGNQVKTETRKEALARGAGPAAESNSSLKSAIEAANAADTAASEANDAAETLAKEIAADEDARDERFVPIVAQGEVVPLATVAQVKSLAKFVDETQQKLKSLKEKADAIQKLIELSPAGKRFISKIAEKLGKVAGEALDVTVQGFMTLAAADAHKSGGRTLVTPGKFGSPHNIQFARDSASLAGLGHAVVYGKASALFASHAQASVVGHASAHLKSPGEVEVAAPKVEITGRTSIDAEGGAIKMVAKKEGFQVRAKKGMGFLAEEEQIAIQALKKNIGVSAKLGVRVESAKENVAIEATAKNIELTSGKLTKIKSKTGEWTTEEGLTVKAGKEIKGEAKEGISLKSKKAQWDVTNKIGINAQTFSVDAKQHAIIKAKSKIKLG